MPSNRDDGVTRHFQRSIQQFSRHQKHRISVSQHVKKRSVGLDNKNTAEMSLANQISNMKLFQRVEDIINRKFSVTDNSRETSLMGGLYSQGKGSTVGDVMQTIELVDLKHFLHEQAQSLTPKRSSQILDIVKHNSRAMPQTAPNMEPSSELIMGSHVIATQKTTPYELSTDKTHLTVQQVK